VKRRDLIRLLGGAVAAWPLAARTQQPERLRHIGVLMNTAANEDQQAGVAAFVQTLQQLGWTEGRNLHLDIRWGGGDPDKIRKEAENLVALAPDVIVSTGNVGVPPLLRATHTIPIVFNNVADPVGAGFIDTMARPGGNATGFIQFEYTISGKWLELLKEVAPALSRVAVLRDPAIAAGVGQFAVIQSVIPSIGVELSAISLRDAGEIERAVTKFASRPNGGLIVTSGALPVVHSKLIIALAAQHHLPTIYYRRYYVTNGGLLSYGYDFLDQYRLAATSIVSSKARSPPTCRCRHRRNTSWLSI
jgi:putative ABC transport system substrate-binding protein